MPDGDLLADALAVADPELPADALAGAEPELPLEGGDQPAKSKLRLAER